MYRFTVSKSLPDLRLIGGEPCPTFTREAGIVADERQRTANEYFQSLSTKNNEYLGYAKRLYLNTQDVGANGGALVYLLTLSGCGDTTLSSLARAPRKLHPVNLVSSLRYASPFLLALKYQTATAPTKIVNRKPSTQFKD